MTAELFINLEQSLVSSLSNTLLSIGRLSENWFSCKRKLILMDKCLQTITSILMQYNSGKVDFQFVQKFIQVCSLLQELAFEIMELLSICLSPLGNSILQEFAWVMLKLVSSCLLPFPLVQKRNSSENWLQPTIFSALQRNFKITHNPELTLSS